ncbi:MAG: indolepyruvate ferredoxin oxidoreductase [Paludibacteraceae bacterium]|jgi:indolepyruvate ferredoxin oxidoreductase alpha subunit|nr:indolepyruvate ferredoxin oxidoreductase [Paludibacteraceae bacterium]MBP6437185.1 indolepyruvate ferredoxin oxidoreductase [Paludibacteraceae bacterium]MBP7219279.1 indolepyruvate ferredoxin oxidoreductase [Paludibacteraceae bacterium]MBP8627001.1 indolepyruvate ferredoxin oxidoreductase [Paludibacteraceae bacterium]MBP8781517.1 indolepyruvate ferredoxin oxidoreductase [Paludibacteraceae bacterium]
MQNLLLLGDEAIAQGAIDGGISGVYAYPGTPSTEITTYIQETTDKREIRSDWSVNEKTAMEAAMGLSYVGKRALVCMKHVGLNVAADAFINAAITGINGGIVVLVADDPSMHSSQNEQDSRFYGKFALIPILEPSNQQEAYDMAYTGFELSEKLGYPILMRITTRLAHSRSGIIRKPQKQQRPISLPTNRKQFILLPAIARQRYSALLAAQSEFEEQANNSLYNEYIDGVNKKMGIIACGLTFNYLMENFPNGCEYPIVKIGQYPLPRKKIERLIDECESILVIEDGYPLVEELLKGYTGKGIQVKGKLDGTLPRQGELNPNNVGQAFGFTLEKDITIPEVVKMRPPSLCKGCGHIDLYESLVEVLKDYPTARVFSDIGCYTLGALPPYTAIDTCLDMGASITMAKGAADGGLHPSVAVIGDSTFTHSGITGLIDCVNDNSNVTIIIVDNETTAMTGGQTSSGTGKLEAICQAVGVDENHIHVCEPLKKNIDYIVQLIKKEISYTGVSVIIPRRECIQTLKRKKK